MIISRSIHVAVNGIIHSFLWLRSTYIGEGNGNPLQYSCLEHPRDGEAWWAAVYGVEQSRTWLKWLNSSSVYTHTHTHVFFIHLAVNGHLGCFHVIAIVNGAVMNIGCMCLLSYSFVGSGFILMSNSRWLVLEFWSSVQENLRPHPGLAGKSTVIN